MTAEELQAIRERTEKATPGPWYAPDGYKGLCAHVQAESGGLETGCIIHGNRFNDAIFMAEARADIPALLAEVERLQAELEQARRWSAAWKAAAKEQWEISRDFAGCLGLCVDKLLYAQQWAKAWKRAAKRLRALNEGESRQFAGVIELAAAQIKQLQAENDNLRQRVETADRLLSRGIAKRDSQPDKLEDVEFLGGA